jgi:thiamine-phosphate pyrophosphorylase
MTLSDQLRLMVLTDPVLLKGRDPVDVCRRAVRGGATMVQVRWKGGPAGQVLDLAQALVAALPVPVIVNDRVDLALAAGAAGAHLGWDDPPLEALRPHVPPGFIIGLSVGSPEEADRARATSADYWSVGPCFASDTKADAGKPLGPAGFGALARLAPDGVPVIGIGGVEAGNAGVLREAGAAGVAVTAAVFGAPDPEAAAGDVLRGLGARG